MERVEVCDRKTLLEGCTCQAAVTAAPLETSALAARGCPPGRKACSADTSASQHALSLLPGPLTRPLNPTELDCRYFFSHLICLPSTTRHFRPPCIGYSQTNDGPYLILKKKNAKKEEEEEEEARERGKGREERAVTVLEHLTILPH